MTPRSDPGLTRPLEKRSVTIDVLLQKLSEQQFEIVLSRLCLGDLTATSYIHWLGCLDNNTRLDNKKHELRGEHWNDLTLVFPSANPKVDHVYLPDHDGDHGPVAF